MTVIINDQGFQKDDWTHPFVPLETLAANRPTPVLAVDLGPDADPEALGDRLDQIDMIRIGFPGFADGRGFTVARRLRLMGFQGRMRASGHVISDQYAMARRAGFDEIEISDELARRQPQEEWLFRADWRDHDYQSRLRG